MYAKSTRPSAKREVQKERSAERDDQIARSNLRAARKARDENMPAKRADFFLLYFAKQSFSMILILETILSVVFYERKYIILPKKF